MTYAEVLAFVFESGRIETCADDDGFLAEVSAEVEFEAGERAEVGDLDGTVEGAVEFALQHVV